MTLTGFLSDVNNFIEKPSGEDYFQNYDKYRFQGLEINAETRFMKNLVLRLGYTFLDTRDESPGTNKDELQYRPRNKLTLEGKYTFFFDFSAYLNIIYVADQVYYSKTTPLKKRDLDNYAVVNLKFDQKLLDNFLDVYLGADNLFDKNYEEGYGFPAPGRVVYGGVALYF